MIDQKTKEILHAIYTQTGLFVREAGFADNPNVSGYWLCIDRRTEPIDPDKQFNLTQGQIEAAKRLGAVYHEDSGYWITTENNIRGAQK